MHDPGALLLEQAQRIQASGLLRGRLLRLFEFLRDSTLAGRTPKELEVARAVFERDAGFDVAQDAMVRVYVHKLRRKLEEYQRGPGAGDPVQVLVPRGEYRLVLERVPVAEPVTPVVVEVAPDPPPPAPAAVPAPSPPAAPAPVEVRHPVPSRRLRWMGAALGVSLLLNGLLAVLLHHHAVPDELREVRNSVVWAPLLADQRPIVVLLGDYYIFGETDSEGMEVQRLIREFSVNSREELARYLQTNPGKIGSYEDMGLSYLPTSTAQVLRDVMPVLLATHRPLRVALVSEASPELLRTADIVYVGLVSGLGMLRDVVFAGSRFTVGDNYDELVDAHSGIHYYSGEEMRMPGQEKYHDFGYFASFPGPDGNHLVVISGMRDTGLMRTGETVTSVAGVRQLASQIAADTPGFESLYEVYGLSGASVGAKLVLAGPLVIGQLWRDTSRAP